MNYKSDLRNSHPFNVFLTISKVEEAPSEPSAASPQANTQEWAFSTPGNCFLNDQKS